MLYIVSLISDFLTQKKIADDTQTSLSYTQEWLDNARKKIKELEEKNDYSFTSSFGSSSCGKNTYYGTSAYNTTWETLSDSRCSHRVGVGEISGIKSCPHCKEKYKERFLDPIRSCRNTQIFFNMLQRGDDVATTVKEQN